MTILEWLVAYTRLEVESVQQLSMESTRKGEPTGEIMRHAGNILPWTLKFSLSNKLKL
jgi:hypothetical protein